MIDSTTKPTQILVTDVNQAAFNTMSDIGMQAPYQKIVEPIDHRITEKKAIFEAKLNLLHECLTPEGAKEVETNFLTPEQIELVEYLATLNDNLAKDYIEKLTELRTSLLGS